MAPKKNKGLSPAQVEELKEAFNLFDTDQSGAIDYKELRAAIKALGLKVKMEELKVEQKFNFKIDEKLDHVFKPIHSSTIIISCPILNFHLFIIFFFCY